MNFSSYRLNKTQLEFWRRLDSGQRQASCFHLQSVLMLSYANLAVPSYLLYRHEINESNSAFLMLLCSGKDYPSLSQLADIRSVKYWLSVSGVFMIFTFTSSIMSFTNPSTSGPSNAPVLLYRHTHAHTYVYLGFLGHMSRSTVFTSCSDCVLETKITIKHTSSYKRAKESDDITVRHSQRAALTHIQVLSNTWWPED